MRSAPFLLLFVTFLMAIPASPVHGQRCSEYAGEGEFDEARESDSDIVEAKRQARATFASIFPVAVNKQDSVRNPFSVEIEVTRNGKVNRVWVNNIREGAAGWFSAQIWGSRQIEYTDGEPIEFQAHQISDWSYSTGYAVKGNFRHCAILIRRSKEARECWMAKLRYSCTP
jgi:uncharacterized protein YegJ (DUF2314 family)